jgi:hypothetical protein
MNLTLGGETGSGGVTQSGGTTPVVAGQSSVTTTAAASGGTLTTGGTTSVGGLSSSAETMPTGGAAAGGANQTAGHTALGGAPTAGGTTSLPTAQGGSSSVDAGSSPDDAGSDASLNQPPVPDLWYEIITGVWVQVDPGDTVVRPLKEGINWGACDSYDPDGHVTEIWLYDGHLTQLMGPSLTCILEYLEQYHDSVNVDAYLLVIDDRGAQTRLDFAYVTQ